MSRAKHKTVVKDIQKYIEKQQHKDSAVDIDESAIADLAVKMAGVVLKLLRPKYEIDLLNEKKIYPSDLGKCHRQVWYKYHPEALKYETEPLDASTLIKFCYGDLIEELLIFLVKQSGHEVTHEQAHVDFSLSDGWVVTGRMDLKIDGHVYDIKTASNYAFKKFKSSELTDDSFGYVWQCLTYASDCDVTTDVNLLVINKQTGELTTTNIPYKGTKKKMVLDVVNQAVDLKNKLLVSTPPPIPSDKLAEQRVDKYGRTSLGFNCSFCPYKKDCFPHLRTLKYSYGTFDWLPDNEEQYKSKVRVPEVQYKKRAKKE